jgi:hypothetical protein
LALVHTNSAVVLTDSALVLTDSALVILINLFSPLRRDGTMRCLAVLVVGLSVPSCTPSPPGSSWTVGKSTQRIMSADGDWFCHYYLFRDGRDVLRQVHIAPTGTEPNPFVRDEGTHLVLDRGQKRIERPAEDGIFVLDDAGQFHRADVTPEEFSRYLSQTGAVPWEPLVSSGAWKDRLYPLVVQHRWAGKPPHP